MPQAPKPHAYDPDLADTVRLLVNACVRETFLAELNKGKSPVSPAGDYSDVMVLTPDGAIPWRQVARITDEELQQLTQEVVNKLYTFLWYQQKQPGTIPAYFRIPYEWEPPQIDADFAYYFEKSLSS
jgi:hypothetical protein